MAGRPTTQYPAHKGPFHRRGKRLFRQHVEAANAADRQGLPAEAEIRSELKELKVVSVGNDVADQIAAIDNFIAAG